MTSNVRRNVRIQTTKIELMGSLMFGKFVYLVDGHRTLQGDLYQLNRKSASKAFAKLIRFHTNTGFELPPVEILYGNLSAAFGPKGVRYEDILK